MTGERGNREAIVGKETNVGKERIEVAEELRWIMKDGKYKDGK